MQPKGPDSTQPVHEQIDPMLIRINSKLKALGSDKVCEKTPERIEGTEVLRNKTVLMLDDELKVLERFLPHLLVATDGKALFLKYNGQNTEDLVRQLKDANAEIVLLDYSLSSTLNGVEVANLLKENGFPGSMIGFSSTDSVLLKKAFLDAGAVGLIEKIIPKPSIKALADFLVAQQ